MSLKLSSSVVDRIADPACEGLWDHIQYLITSDKSIAEKIGNMMYQMQQMDDDKKKALESLKIPFKMEKIEKVKLIMEYSRTAVDFVVEKVRKYEDKAYVTLEDEKNQIKNEVDSAAASFESQHNSEDIIDVLNNETAEKDKTYAVMGFTFDNLYSLAKEFKDNQAGRLTKMRKMKFINYMAAHGTKNDGHVHVINKACMQFVKLLNRAMDCYSYVNKFLFFTYKEMLRNDLIRE